MGAQKWHFLILTSLLLSFPSTSPSSIGSPVHHERRREAIEVEGGPGSVVWVVQLSDLHFSVFHPDRASDFRRYVGPALSIIKPSLVLITGDLTDGKSKDLLTMKQEEREWIEYENATREVIMTSGLDERIFYDLRGNHDSFGVPVQGGTNDFYEKYSINARLRRNGNVQSVTLKTRDGKHLFVGIDSTLATAGLRGPTNLFGHPTDQLLETIDKALSEWDNSNQFVTSQVTKVVFGHFPLSFTALTETQRNLKEVFLKHSISAYLCGHLHARFGRNLKRHHLKSQNEYFQYNMHESTREVYINETEGCQKKKKEIKEFWEWEMGDWRKRRSFRILAIDSGDVSFVDVDFKYGSRDIIIVPTFPLDSRIMQRISSTNDFKCQNKETRKYETIRALVFSKHQVASVAVKVYDYRSGTLNLVLDSEMKKMEAKENKRGELYFVPWNWRAFVDTSPDRYWIKIEATDMTGDTVSSPLKPFSINGLSSTMSWSWTEFMVMGCQWAVIYWPALWFIFAIAFLFLLVQKIALAVWKNHNIRGKNFREYLISGLVCLFTELPRISTIWTILFGYLVYLLLLPWLFGYAITEEGNLMYMTYRGWSDATLNGVSEGTGVGFPDVMVIALPHLVWVVLPAILVMASLAAERSVYRIVFLSLTGKKEDDNGRERNSGGIKGHLWSGRWIRKFLLVASIAIVWKHWKQCRALVKAYEINPFIHAPVYCFFIPALLAFCIYKTSSI
ncbi:Calcineurin-related phosphoesterase-like [Rhynchospora pubera]|uniref:Calcineurin-related phosphoesterase-like n=1 Tax=Rhynchospora pubera TaxID=906938 RepID=A0AAV8G6E5_9POAL|nr:Calcineurin-related phosphoesterase-like [Rhynchospora pubera]